MAFLMHKQKVLLLQPGWRMLISAGLPTVAVSQTAQVSLAFWDLLSKLDKTL